MVDPLVLALFLSAAPVPDHTPARSFPAMGEFDHLQPSSLWPRSDEALIRYLESSMYLYAENLSIRQAKDGTYILKVWETLKNDVKESDIPTNAAPPRQSERETPKDIAVSACDLWARCLGKVREEKSNVMICDGRQDYYAAFVHGKGWTQGMANTPLMDLPPRWLEQAADALKEFGWHGDAPKCRKTLADLRQRLSAYEKLH